MNNAGNDRTRWSKVSRKAFSSLPARAGRDRQCGRGSNDGTSETFFITTGHKNSRGAWSHVAAHGTSGRRPGATRIRKAAVFRRSWPLPNCFAPRPARSSLPTSPGLAADWVGNLLQPVYRQDFDFVAPLYSRQRFDGLLARQSALPDEPRHIRQEDSRTSRDRIRFFRPPGRALH